MSTSSVETNKKTESKEKPKNEGVREKASSEVARFARGVFLARIEALASFADILKDLATDITTEEKMTTSETVGDLIRNIPDTVVPAMEDAKEKQIDIPGKMLDKFYHEFRGEEGKVSS